MTGRKKVVVFKPGGQKKHVLGRTRSAQSLAASVYDERRAEVYQTDVPYADEEPSVPLPRGEERAALAERLRALKADGATHVQAGIALGLDVGQVSVLCREFEIKSVTRAGRKKGYDPVPPGDSTSGVT